MMYKYITENNLENRQFYMYCEFEGMNFLKAYFKTRTDFIDGWKSDKDEGYFVEKISLESRTDAVLYNLLCEDFKTENKKMIDWFTKDFEVRKRVYTSYDDITKKPEEGADYHRISPYILLGYVMSKAYVKTENYKYLNCLLKIDDTLLSLIEQMSENEVMAVKKLLETEIDYVAKILETKKIESGVERNDIR